MKQERKQYPVPAMMGLLSTVGGACWAGVCLCLRSLHFPAAHWALQVSLALVLLGLAELMVLACISVYRSARYSKRVEIPLVLNRVVWQEEEVPHKEGQPDETSEYTGCRMMGEYCARPWPGQILPGQQTPGRAAYFYTAELNLHEAENLPWQATAFVNRKNPADYVVVAGA